MLGEINDNGEITGNYHIIVILKLQNDFHFKRNKKDISLTCALITYIKNVT